MASGHIITQASGLTVLTLFMLLADPAQAQGRRLGCPFYTALFAELSVTAVKSVKLPLKECLRRKWLGAFCHLNTHKSMGPDGTHPRVLRELAGVISKIVTQDLPSAAANSNTNMTVKWFQSSLSHFGYKNANLTLLP